MYYIIVHIVLTMLRLILSLKNFGGRFYANIDVSKGMKTFVLKC